jgi:hypothetical protein|tara:strand:- start:193 stop:570 length:378 start_codon:yes stop_codon:yes gene_type:complete
MSVEYYKKALKREQLKNRFAWGQYFQLRNELFENQKEIYMSELSEVPDELGTHLKKFISELYDKSKTYCQCAICMDVILTSETLDTTPCGHNFHKECLTNLKKHFKDIKSKTVPCPNCRTELWIK